MSIKRNGKKGVLLNASLLIAVAKMNTFLVVLVLFTFFTSYSWQTIPNLATVQKQIDKAEFSEAINELKCITDELKENYENPCKREKCRDLDDFEECTDRKFIFTLAKILYLHIIYLLNNSYLAKYLNKKL